jgi:hypothetical protein
LIFIIFSIYLMDNIHERPHRSPGRPSPATTLREPTTANHPTEEPSMPRIIVTTDPVSSELTDTPVLLEEHVHSVHLSTGHAAAQLIERLAWAISDAEHAEGERPARQRRARQRRPARIRQSAPYTQQAIRA